MEEEGEEVASKADVDEEREGEEQEEDREGEEQEVGQEDGLEEGEDKAGVVQHVEYHHHGD